ncbi:MAG: hypothetical protein U1C52_01955, partial [Patescibacteria group bacterium]|nr:hypothetical protein [Patescibacteria group bacterium]
MEKNLYKSIFRATVILISLALIFSVIYQVPQQTPERVSLTEIARLLGENQVASIEVNGDELNIFLRDDTELVAKKEAGVGVTETLVNLGVSPEQLTATQIETVEESGFKFWMGILLPTLLPLLIFVAVFYFI